MNTYTFVTTNDHDLGLQLAVDKANAARSRDVEGNLTTPEVTLEGYFQARIKDVLDSYVHQYREEEGERRKQAYLAEAAGSAAVSTLEQTRQAKLGELLAAYNAKLADGIIPTGSTITLAAGATDQAAFTKLVTLLREVEEMQPTDEAKSAFRSSPQTIVDINSTPHLVTVTQVRELVVDYGMQLAALWTEHAQKRAAVLAAGTVEEINAVSY